MKQDDLSIEERGPLGPGTLIGVYRVEAPLGEGGMGTVYRATDTKLNRPVAIKLLSDEFADVAARRRFQREAQLASSLNHPHILTVYDVGELDGRQYLVTEFVDGGTLKDWARAEKRTWRQIVDLLTGVADGLAAAHAAGITHRDIKPANILVAKNGYAKLADFGLAKLVENSDPDATRTLAEGQTKPGMVIGTVAYMSPEQASGQKLDGRSDIFSFGIVLYELLAGKRPFSGSTDLELLKTIIHTEPAPLNVEIPVALDSIVEKALEKLPTERYQSMKEMTVDLRRISRDKPAQASPVTPKAQRSGGWTWAAGLIGLSAGAVATWLLVGPTAPPNNPLANAKVTRLTDFDGVERDGAISADGKFVVFASDKSGPLDVWLRQVDTGTFANLTNGTEPNLDGGLRMVGFTGDGTEVWFRSVDPAAPIRAVPLVGGAARVLLATSPVKSGPFNVAWSPNGQRLVYHPGAEDGDPMFLADRAGADAHQILISAPGTHNHYPVWSQDGQWIYFVRGSPDSREMDLWRIAAIGGEAERLTQQNTDLSYPAPVDDRTLAYVARDKDGAGPWLWTLDLKTKETHRVNWGLEHYTSVSASADGRRLVATLSNSRAGLWTVPLLMNGIAGEREVKPFELPAATVRALAPRFYKESLFYLSSHGTGDGLWRSRGTDAVEVWKSSDGALLEPAAISRDGKRVAVVLRRDGKVRLSVGSSDGSDFQMLSDIDVRGAPDWSPDGQWVVTGGSDAGGKGLFKIPVNGGPPIKLAKGAASNPVWQPDGDLIVYTGVNVSITSPLLAVRQDGTAVPLPEIKVRREGVRARFLPDGKGLAYMQGTRSAQDFWLLNLETKKQTQLTQFSDPAAMLAFDITADGKQIVFDRVRENSDIVLIELPAKP